MLAAAVAAVPKGSARPPFVMDLHASHHVDGRVRVGERELDRGAAVAAHEEEKHLRVGRRRNGELEVATSTYEMGLLTDWVASFENAGPPQDAGR
jgi:hypothetical protein